MVFMARARQKSVPDYDALFDAVSARISPSPESAAAEREFALSRIGKLEQALSREDVRIYFIGSAARDTGLAGDRDIDLFVAFPRILDRDAIVEKTRKALSSGLPGEWQMHYAEHPYFQCVVDGFKVEVIPCFRAEPNQPIKSAVDRSPLHMDYLQKRLSSKQKRDVRILKFLFKRAGIYGAEASIGGFSGLLCEYLVLNYRSLVDLMAAAGSWQPPVVVDIEAAYAESSAAEVSERFGSAPLVVVDAIDKNRNAAAAVALSSLAAFISLSSGFLASKSPADFFKDKPAKALSAAQASAEFKKRGTGVVMVELPLPSGMVEDVYYPQLRKAAASLSQALAKSGFSVVGHEVFVDKERAVILVESLNATVSPLDVLVGPPCWFHEPIARFVASHERDAVRGPFIVGDRVVVEVRRNPELLAVAAKRLLADGSAVSLGANLGPAFKRAVVADGVKGSLQVSCASKYLSRKAFWL